MSIRVRLTAWYALTLALALAVVTIALYLPYRVFDDWWYIRFLLPAIPFLIVLSVATVARIADASNRKARSRCSSEVFGRITISGSRATLVPSA